MSAIELLQQQHREVHELFQRIKASRGMEKISLLGQVAEDLTIHAALEEQFFYPLAREKGVDGLIDESYQDHAEVKRLLSDLIKVKQTDPKLDELCGRLERLVTEHVEQEERALLPKVEAQVERRELDSLGEEMKQAVANWRHRELLKMAENQETPLPVP